jgi:hypothetical protein
MYELHAWALLSDDTYESESDKIMEVVEDLKPLLARFPPHNTDASMRWLNGAMVFTLSLMANRRRFEADLVDTILDEISRRLPGSSGLVYDRDHDSPEGNQFRVRVLARGQIIERGDPFLSPCRPTIED